MYNYKYRNINQPHTRKNIMRSFSTRKAFLKGCGLSDVCVYEKDQKVVDIVKSGWARPVLVLVN